MSSAPTAPGVAGGRRRLSTTTREDIGAAALRLFAERGFDEVTVDDVAQAAGVSRRTLFRSYASKNDMVWGDFGRLVSTLRAQLAEAQADEPLADALRAAIVASHRWPARDLPALRMRMRLISTVPALRAHGVLRHDEWRAVVGEFAAQRRGERPDDLVPQLIAHATLGTTLAALEWWVRHGHGHPADVVDHALAELACGFDARR